MMTACPFARFRDAELRHLSSPVPSMVPVACVRTCARQPGPLCSSIRDLTWLIFISLFAGGSVALRTRGFVVISQRNISTPLVCVCACVVVTRWRGEASMAAETRSHVQDVAAAVVRPADLSPGTLVCKGQNLSPQRRLVALSGSVFPFSTG